MPRDAVLTPALTGADARADRLREIGFPAHMETGQTLLPAVVGPRSRINADGEDVPRRDMPKEVVSRLAWARWIERHGREQRVIRGVRPWSYVRFPRAHVPAPHLELQVCRDDRGGLVVATRPIARGREDALLLHAVNLLLELFGECTLIDEGRMPLVRAEGPRLNWDVGPPSGDLEPLVAGLPDTERRVAEYRLARMRELGPDFTAVGRAGFRGCAVFGFAARGRMVVERLHGDTATYVTERSWDDLAALGKDELIDEVGREGRIDHRPGWEGRLRAAVAGD